MTEPFLPQHPIKTPLIRLSQGQLNLLETCPPQFQRIYLEQLVTPVSPQQHEKLSWGSQFHQLMQQRELGLPIDSLLEADKQLQQSITALRNTAAEIWQPNGDTWREAEHCRTLYFKEYLLTVVYDLLILGNAEGKILDWKTYLQPEDPILLAKNWQTRLYLYVLAETGDYPPENISMTYWFVKLPTQPQSLTFSYDRIQHEKTHQDLTRLLTQLDKWLEDYRNQGIDFPHFSQCQTSCPYYSGTEKTLSIGTNKSQDWPKPIDEIDEIPL